MQSVLASTGAGTWSGRQGYGGGFRGRGPKDYQRSDERIREEISDRMTDDDNLDASDITIQVKQGEVTLIGTVTTRDQKRRAEDLAESISGVREVTNNIRVAREQETAHRPQSESVDPRVLTILRPVRGRAAGRARARWRSSRRRARTRRGLRSRRPSRSSRSARTLGSRW